MLKFQRFPLYEYLFGNRARRLELIFNISDDFLVWRFKNACAQFLSIYALGASGSLASNTFCGTVCASVYKHSTKIHS